MSTTYNGTAPSRTAIDGGVHAAFNAEGLVTDEGSIDKPGMRERIFDAILKRGKVLSKGERADKATQRGDLVADVFPHLIDPDHVQEQDDPVLALAVYKAVDKLVWEATKTGARDVLQRLVGVNMGNGYVLCRTKVGRDGIDAVYITDDLACIRLDFTRPENEAIDRKLATATSNREMLVMRQPYNAAKYAQEYAATLKAATLTAGGQMQLAVQSVTGNGDSEEAGDDE